MNGSPGGNRWNPHAIDILMGSPRFQSPRLAQLVPAGDLGRPPGLPKTPFPSRFAMRMRQSLTAYGSQMGRRPKKAPEESKSGLCNWEWVGSFWNPRGAPCLQRRTGTDQKSDSAQTSSLTDLVQWTELMGRELLSSTVIHSFPGLAALPSSPTEHLLRSRHRARGAQPRSLS